MRTRGTFKVPPCLHRGAHTSGRLAGWSGARAALVARLAPSLVPPPPVLRPAPLSRSSPLAWQISSIVYTSAIFSACCGETGRLCTPFSLAARLAAGIIGGASAFHQIGRRAWRGIPPLGRCETPTIALICQRRVEILHVRATAAESRANVALSSFRHRKWRAKSIGQRIPRDFACPNALSEGVRSITPGRGKLLLEACPSWGALAQTYRTNSPCRVPF